LAGGIGLVRSEIAMQNAEGKGSANPRQGMSRRRFLQGVGVAGVGAVLVEPGLLRGADATADVESGNGKSLSGTVSIQLNLNGQVRKVQVEPRTTLLNALRNNL